jgi:hypothetical protein
MGKTEVHRAPATKSAPERRKRVEITARTESRPDATLATQRYTNPAVRVWSPRPTINAANNGARKNEATPGT